MLEIFSGIDTADEEESSLPWDFGIDFETGLLNGKIVYGAEALAVWCYFALNIQRYRYRAFSWNYGSESDKLIGHSYGKDYTESEIKRMISECVCCHPNISGIEEFSIKFSESNITVSFRIITDFGNSDINIVLAGE